MNDKITNHVTTMTGKTIDSSQRRGMWDDTCRHSDCLRDTSLLSLGHCRREVQRIVALS